MGKWNEQAAPNNNLKPVTIGTSTLVNNQEITASKINNETKIFAEGKENQIIKNQLK